MPISWPQMPGERCGGPATRRSGKATALVNELERTVWAVEQIVAQTRTRLAGEVPAGADRVVSLHDTDARPIAKGRLGRPVEFGYKAQVTDNAQGIVLDHIVEKGNPPDAPMLAAGHHPRHSTLRQGRPRRSPPTAAMAKLRWRLSSSPWV